MQQLENNLQFIKIHREQIQLTPENEREKLREKKRQQDLDMIREHEKHMEELIQKYEIKSVSSLDQLNFKAKRNIDDNKNIEEDDRVNKTEDRTDQDINKDNQVIEQNESKDYEDQEADEEEQSKEEELDDVVDITNDVNIDEDEADADEIYQEEQDFVGEQSP
ncbi:MAG: hypothetical protein EZS28_045682 [Streblomastix strix]|uniref:Uncharacterized protein n=1 Tax=Streblomastix strix TaxID=222440 RepID=A0A5J4TN00_9EUKA|nr:MAG: hypothetical protein EZS28_045682 [Streblomastix strix]